MLSSGYQSSSQMLQLYILMIGFDEAEISPSSRSVFTSLEPQPSVEWVSAVQKGHTQDVSGKLYDVIILDCRKDEEVWGQARQIAEEKNGAVVIGIINVSEPASGPEKITEDAIGFRVDESVASTVLRLVFQQAKERKQLFG